MEDEYDLIASKKVEPITFGSCISISLEKYKKCYISMESFISTKLNIKKFDSTSLSSNLNFSVFRILPFSNFANFKNQDTIHHLLKNFTEEAALLSDKELKERKDIIRDLKSNLDSEIHTNMVIYNKLKGTPVLFGSSVFQLVHVATMKYLSLNDSDKDNLSFDLIDYPNNRSFFKFLPCLKLQKQRNNFVYDKDLVVISSTRTILNRSPSLFTDYEQSTEQGDLGDSNHTGKVSANIEATTHWKLHLYQHETDDDMEKNCLRVNDAIWLNLSETNHILTTTLQTDPFEQQHMFENGQTSRRGHSVTVDDGDVSKEHSPERDGLDESGTIPSARGREDTGKLDPFFESEILSRLVLEFKEAQENKSSKTSAGSMPGGGLWRFESTSTFEGGPLEWDRPYRLKHVLTRRYLRVQRVSNKKYYVELSNVVDDNLLFHLVPVKNLLRGEEEKRYVAKDAYFKLQHVNTKQWISFRGEALENRKKEGQSLKVPTLSSQPREIDTFKMIKADFEETWEISFILSAVPTFVDLIEYMKPMENKALTPAELHALKIFDEIADKAIDCIDSLEAFCYNKLPANLAMNQEFLHISPIRQRVLREQYILGILCWLLSRGFPTKEELEKVEWEQLEQSIRKHQQKQEADSSLIKQLPDLVKKQSKKQDIYKINYIRKKYVLCLKIYEFIKVICIQNTSNQEYAFKFLSFYVNHLGHGGFVSELIREIIRNNEKILYGLHASFGEKMLTNSMTGDQEFKAIHPEGKTFLREITNKFREFEPYEKRELLRILKISCLYQEQALYINQDKVFRLIFEDISFRNSNLVNLTLKGDELIIGFRDVHCPFGSFFSEENLDTYKTEIEFLKDQLDLYATLCMNRNYSCAGTFRKIFPIDILIRYITNEQIPEDIRASLVKLITTIHIDKEPRTVQEKPNLVRVLEVDLDEIQRKIKGRNLFHLPGLGLTSSMDTRRDLKSDKKKIYIELMQDKSPALLEHKSPDKVPESRDEELRDEQLEKLKIFILRYLSEKSELCAAKEPNGQIYTRLTSEVVKVTAQMLKFGMFNTKLAKQSLRTQFLAGVAHGLMRTALKEEEPKKHKRESEFEKLICYLTPILEFDEEYFKALNQLGMKRKQYDKAEDDNNMLSTMLQGATGLGKSLFALKDIFTLGSESVDKRAKKAAHEETEAEVIRDQIFKKAESLKKVLNKFSNKTYAIKEEEVEGNYEVDIKIGICDAFDYIFNMREDFVIDNLVNFFRGPFLEKIYEDTSKDFDKFDLLSHLKTLLPDSSLEVGCPYKEEESVFRNYTQYEELRSFDAVLEKPFIESLLLSFFFTNSAPLQNALVKLLERCCSEKANLRDSIEKLELLVSEEHKALHSKLRKKLNTLKNLTSNSQVWLQIIERSFYQPNYFNIMEACYKKLNQIQAIFKASAPEDESLTTKQRIFRYLGGHKTIFEVLQKGFLVFESYVEVFRQADTSELTLKYRIDVADKIVLLFRACHSLLGQFCYKNPRYQYLLYQSFNRLMLVNKLNLGQIELMVEVFRDNYDLARTVSEAKLKTFCDMIGQHGRKEVFLQVFDTLISHPEQDTLDIQKKVLLVLLNDDYSSQINPFVEFKGKLTHYRNAFEPDTDSFFYTSKFIEIIAKCLRGKISVTLISKVFKYIQIKDLVELLYNITPQEHDLLRAQKQTHEMANYLKYIEAAKSGSIEILLVFFATFSQSFDDLNECTKTLFSYIDLETKRITHGNPHPSYLVFMLEKLVPLVSICVGNYLKDSGALNINFEHGQENYQVEAASKRCALRLAKHLLTNFEDYTTKIQTTNELQVRSLVRLAGVLKLQIPSILRDFLNELEEQRSISEEDYIAAESPTKRSSRSQKQIESDRIRNQRFLSGASSNFAGGGGPVVRDRMMPKKLTISEMLQSQGSPAGQVTMLWRTFKDKILQSDYLKKAIKDDVNVLSNSIMNFSAAFVESEDKEIRDFYIKTEDLLVKFFDYLEYWIQKKAKKESVIFLIKGLSRIIKNVSDDEEERVDRQEMFDRLNATKIMLVLIWEEKHDDTQYLYSIFNFMIHLLSGGNQTVQKTIFDFFNNNSSSEKFFRKVNDVILREITQVDFSSKYSVSKEISHLGMKLLRLLQLFCEGHNNDLQNYLRQQVNSKNSYDLVTLTTKLLSSYRVNSKNFESVMQCFDTLTELVQGPCLANQVTIVNSKFLEFAVSLLNEEEKAIDYFHSSGPTGAAGMGSGFFMDKSGKTSRMTKASKIGFQSSGGSFSSPGTHTESNSMRGSGTASFAGGRRKRMRLTADQLAKVKYKCLVTLISLLECSSPGSTTASRVIRAIPVSVLTNNLVQVHQQYKRIYKKGEYPASAFGHHQDDYVPEKPEHAGFIIENGFNIYILINLFLDFSSRDNVEDEELSELVDQTKDDKLNKTFNEGLIGELTKFWSSLFSNFVGIMDMVKKNVIDKAIKSGMVNEEEAKLLKEEIEKKQQIQDAIAFFRTNVAHIEVVRNNKLQKVYFPVLPYCKYLSDDCKEDFNDSVNRASTKSKLLDLMEKSDYLIKNMKHEEKMEYYFNQYKILGLITNHVKLWEYASTILGVALNIIIISSYTARYGDRLEDPHLFFHADGTGALSVINTLGVLNLVFSSLVVAHFFLKRAPLLIEDIWIGFFDQILSFTMPFRFVAKVVHSFLRGLTDFDILYNCLEILFAILGLAVHPFFFFFMLMDIARIELLRNVFKAVWEPKVSLILTILVFLLAEYYFALIGYTFFNSHYDNGETCESLWECFLTCIDYTFKETGALGAYLQDPSTLYDPNAGAESGGGESGEMGETGETGLGETGEEEEPELLMRPGIYWARFFFDNMFKIIIVMIIVNMVAGIIIDTFGALKDALQAKEEDMTRFCFVCGIDREKLDKSSDTKQGYESHIKKDHYMWNYVFYKAYLQFKDSTEYDGNESYIAERIAKFDIAWFPINRAMIVKDEESEVNEKADRVSKVTRYVADIRTKLRGNITRMNKLAETLEN